MTDLDTMIRQAEMQQLQAQLNQQFHKNMMLFKVSAPGIFNAFQNYQPSNIRISYSPEGYITLVQGTQQTPVYEGNPATFSKQQLQAYEENPTCLRLNFLKSHITSDNYIHAPLVNELIDHYETIEIKEHLSLNEPISFMILAGCGLGYQLRDLVDNYDIYNLMIVEPSIDCFYASLHTIDWQPIIDKLTVKNRTLKFCIGYSTADSLSAIKQLPNEIGLHNLSNSFLLQHLHSPQLNDFCNLLIKSFHQLATGVGFFDDEAISLSHTLSNIKHQTPALTSNNTYPQKKPVVIVGNGPSLDELVNTLKQIRNQVTLISCGTALGSLFKIGIKPDYHVEMERVLSIKDWITHGTTPEYLKNITLLTLNTCPPQVIDLFDNCIMAKKPNDLGGLLIDSFCTPAAPDFNFCNPTVSNAGLAYAIAMGFKEIYLLGVDLAYHDASRQHSSFSQYAETEAQAAKQQLNINIQAPWLRPTETPSTARSFQIRGNAKNTVFTTVTLDTSRVNIEQLLAKNPDITCYNPNKGAYIEHTTLISPEQIIEQVNSYPPQKTSTSLLNSHCLQLTIKNEQALLLDCLKHIKPVAESIDGKLMDSLNSMFIQHSQDSNPVAKQLFIGSINCYLAIIARYCQFSEDKSYALKGLQIINQFLLTAKKRLEKGLFDADNSRHVFSEQQQTKTPSAEVAAPIITPVFEKADYDRLGYAGPFAISDFAFTQTLAQEIDQLTHHHEPHTQSASILNLLCNDDLKRSLAQFVTPPKAIYHSVLHWIPPSIEASPWGKNNLAFKDNALIFMSLSSQHHPHIYNEIAVGSHFESGNPEEILARCDVKSISLKEGEFVILHPELLTRSPTVPDYDNALIALSCRFSLH